MDKFADQIYALSKKVIHFYFGEFSIDEIVPFLDKNFSWCGIRKDESGNSLDEAIQFYTTFAIDEDTGYWAENMEYRTVTSTKEVYVSNCVFDLCYQSNDYASKIPIITTFIYHMDEQNEIKLLNFHMSIRTTNKENITDIKPEDDFFVKEYSVDDISKDYLTKLYSGNVAVKLIRNYILHNHGGAKAALILIDIDNFKQINEMAGFRLGDKVLTEMGEKLKVLFRKTDIVSRSGADNFLIFMKDIADEFIIFKKAQQISQALNDVYTIKGENISITVTIGAAYMDNDVQTYEELMKRATEALKYAWKQGKGQCAIYNQNGYMQQNAMLTHKAGTGSYDKINVIPACLNLLTEIKDSKVAITKVLETIGELYSLKRAYLFEFSKDDRCIAMNYEWYSNNEESIKLQYIKKEFCQIAKMLNYYNKHDMYIWTADTEIDAECKACIPPVTGTGLQMLAFAQEKPLGILGIEHPEGNYQFTKEEITLFQYVAKLIGVKIENSRYEEEISRLSGFDAVTGLMNFVSFCNHAEELLLQNPDDNYAVCSFELSSLNEVSEWYGHTTGNKMVKHFASLLQDVLPNTYYVTRNGHSVFHVLAGVNNHEQFIHSLNELYKNKKLYLEDEILPFTFSGGVYFFNGNDKLEFSYLVDRSDIARKNVSEKQHTFVIYDNIMEKKVLKEQKIASRMTEALVNKEFKIYMQPKYRISDESFIGSEALVRWISPKFGFLPPNQFIPLFEKNEFIVELDFYVLNNVCEYIQRRFDSQMDIYSISVNQSRITISRTDYIKRLKEVLDQYNFPRKYIELEITESVFADNLDDIIKVVEQIKVLGCMISIDDFGSGYSSLNMIRKIPFDVLKIDREFLPEQDFTDNSFHVLESIVEMARKINVQVICEGVETRTQIDYLEQIGCDQVQGYYFSKPMPIEIFDDYIYNTKRSNEVLKRLFEISLDQASKSLSGIYNKKFYIENPRSCPNRTRQLLKLIDTAGDKDMIGVKSIFLNSEVHGSIFVMVKKRFAISMLNNELDKDDDEIISPLFHLNENAIVKLEEMGREITTAYAHQLEERSGVKINSFSVEVFKENVEDMLQYVVSEINGLTEKVHCIENRLYIHRNYREEMVAQVFLFMDKEAEKLVIDSMAKLEMMESQTNNA